MYQSKFVFILLMMLIGIELAFTINNQIIDKSDREVPDPINNISIRMI